MQNVEDQIKKYVGNRIYSKLIQQIERDHANKYQVLLLLQEAIASDGDMLSIQDIDSYFNED